MNPARAAWAMPAAFLGMGLLIVVDALAKHLAPYGALETVALRYAAQAVCMAGIVAILRPRGFARANLPAHVGRAVLTLFATSTFFYALGHLPLGLVFALNMTAPVLMAGLGVGMLKERLPRLLVGALGLALAGMLVIAVSLEGGSVQGSVTLALAAAIAGPAAYALSVVLLRKQAVREPATLIILTQSCLVALFAMPLSAADARWPDAAGWLGFATMGVFGVAGLLCLTFALSHVTAARYSIAEYASLLWAALIGYAVFGEVPSAAFWIGGALIVGGCVLALRAKETR